MNKSTEPQLPDVPLTYMEKEQDFSFLWLASPLFIFVLLDIILRFIHCLITQQKEKKVVRKQLTKTRGGAFRVKGKQTISNKKNCYKCASDCECIGVWEIDSTTV